MKLLPLLPFLTSAGKYDGHHLVEINVENPVTDLSGILENLEKNRDVTFLEELEDFRNDTQGCRKYFFIVVKTFELIYNFNEIQKKYSK